MNARPVRSTNALSTQQFIGIVAAHYGVDANLVRRAKARLKESAELRKQCRQIERKLGLKTEDQV